MKSKINEQLDPQSAKRFWIGILTEQEEDYFIASLETAITRMKSGFWYKWSTAAQVRTKYAADLLAMLREDRAERPS
jgi:hypothetical protein